MNDNLSFFSLHSFAKSHINSQLIHAMKPSSICTRSIAAVVALSLAAIAAPSASAQTTATTVPVGFITKTIPAAGSPGSTAALSIPLYQTADFQSSVATTPTAGSHTIALNSAAFTTAFPAGQFTNTPHLVRVKSGGLTGKFWTILSYTATTLDLKEPNGGTPTVADANLTGLLANDSCEIVSANTLGSTFGSIPGLLQGSVNTADNILIWNGAGYSTYFQNSSGIWKTGLTTSTNTIIFPDDAIFFIRRGAADLPITLMGTVPSTVERTELAGAGGTTFMSNRFPVDVTLGTSGIENATNWVKGTGAGSSDNVLLWNGGGFDTYFFNSSSNLWKKGLTTSTNVSITSATGFFVIRTATSLDGVLTQSLPYTP